MVAGDVINTGARLQSAAPPGRHPRRRADLSRRPSARSTIASARAGRGQGQGRAASRLARPRASRSGFGGSTSPTRRAPLVGRDDELDLLVGALARARTRERAAARHARRRAGDREEPPRARALARRRRGSRADRLAAGTLASVRRGRRRSGRSGRSSRRRRGSSRPTARTRPLRSSPHRSRDLVADATERPWVERHLRPLSGVQQTTSSAGRPTATRPSPPGGDSSRRSPRSSPAVLVFEDLHWADDALLDFVDALADRVAGVPLLVVCTARPELLERRPGWGGGKRNATRRSRSRRLSDDDTARLSRRRCSSDPVFRPISRPLSCSAPAETRSTPRSTRACSRTAANLTLRLPRPLQGVVAARIDALPAAEKELLQHAAVLGKVFWTDALAPLGSRARGSWTRRLHASSGRSSSGGSTARRSPARSSTPSSTRSCATARTARCPRSARADVHRRVADWIESLPADRADDRTEILAHHLLEAIEYSRAAGVEAADLVPRAAKALRESGDRALEHRRVERRASASMRRLRELDSSVEDDPYFLLSLGLALATVRLHRGRSGRARTRGRCARDLRSRRRRPGDDHPRRVRLAGRRPGWRVRLLRPARGLSSRALRSRARSSSSSHRWRAFSSLPDATTRRWSSSSRRSHGRGARRRRAARGRAQQPGGRARQLGDPGWEEDIERSLELALRANSFRVARAYINLGSTLLDMAGDLVRGRRSRARVWPSRADWVSRRRRCAGSSGTWPNDVPHRRVGRGDSLSRR